MLTPVVVAQSPCMGYGGKQVLSPRFKQSCFCPHSGAGDLQVGSRLHQRIFSSGCSGSRRVLLGEKGRMGPLGGSELMPA